MSQIHTSNLPDYLPEPRVANTAKVSAETAGPVPQPGSGTAQDNSQLTQLGGVLNNLRSGAASVRTQASDALNAVRSGSYQIDPLQVSRAIVSDSIIQRQLAG